MAVRDSLHKSKLTRFRKWLQRDGWAIQRPKSIYEVLRATKADHDTMVIYVRDDALEHLSVPSKWLSTVRRFISYDKGNSRD